jgi:hypothetical protein
MKIFSFIHGGAPASASAFPDDGGDRMVWLRDPLSHPAIEQMSERELADLPFRTTAGPTATERCRSA